MGRTKKFAKNPEEVRHFKLVARSQNDPDIDDAAPLVLEPFAPLGSQRRSGLSQAELLQIPESLQVLGPETFGLGAERSDAAESSGSRRRHQDDEDAALDDELDGDCYFPKDGYNYEKHLKKVSGGKAGGVVGVVLDVPINERTKEIVVHEKDIAMQVATNDDEAEVLRALEFADEYEEMEDEEFEDILPTGIAEPPEALLWGPTALQDNHLPDLAFFKGFGAGGDFGDEHDEEMDVRAHPNGEAIATAEEFERFFNDEYGEDDDGACEEEEIEGKVPIEKCEAVLDEYLHFEDTEHQKLYSLYEPQEGKLDDVPRVIEETKAIIARHYEQEGDEETTSGEESEDESRNWDCETVLSTLSNLSNRPGKIGKIKVVKKPAPQLKSVKESAEGAGETDADEEEDEEVVELPDVVTERPRGETPEERKLRKASVKEMRKVCRKMKKESKEMYKSEAAKLAKPGNGDVRPNSRKFRL